MTTETFLENFAHLLDAPNGIAKLRELILQLAVQGKLVPQNSSDEPASKLLERILGAKDSSTKRETHKNFLPKNWIWVYLPEIGVINPRNTFDDDSEAAFVPMTLIPEEYGSEVKQEVRKWRDIKKGYTHFAEGDIAFAKITPCFQNSKAAVMRNLKNGVGAGTTELHVFRPFANVVIPNYVLIYFKTPKYILEALPLMTGTAGQQRVPSSYVINTPFPLPPLEEQKRIVAKVDELMKLCDALEGQLSQAEHEGERLVEAIVNHLANAA